ncbi:MULTISPECIES: hypothetical protein [unclassified Streptomyces]|uniref:hypothetical protein n=1 Tax=unclassified Streptomyces TaxID=2593676 RepID=UPI000DC7D922|nr:MULTISPECIES: hypothetical protein [unclassified Streptomyces]AWZ08346.1 hypothetical protein DRB89_31405 [Streptomyces sp. ICC4]AWZ16140.1 hypothetical protein DRB96_32240 [Streptomyces sp. ICC1]
MSLHAKEFFDRLELPFPFGTVVGDVYYATPTASPIRLRIEFARTIRDREYGGLRLTLIHAENGTLDTVHLSFAEHGTFTRRDAERGPGTGHGVIRDWHKDGPPPWAGADLTGLRTVIVDFVQVSWPALITPAGFAERSPWAERWHEELWATDTVTLTRLHEATEHVLALVDGGTYDDVPITDSLLNARYYVRDMLGLRLDQGMVAEAEAVIQLTGRPLGPETADALTRIASMPMDQQRAIAHAAWQRHAATPTAPSTSAPPARSVPAPAPAQTPARSR